MSPNFFPIGFALSLSLILYVGAEPEPPQSSGPTGTGAVCPRLQRMEVLPGQGWDNLRNKDMGQVLAITYDRCKTTEDGIYLLPDDVHASPLKESNLQITSELIDHWTNYTSIVAKSFRTNVGGRIGPYVGVQASFSDEYQNAKQHQVEDKSMTTRVQLRNTMYSVQASPTSQIESGLKNQLLLTLHELDNGNMEKADLLLELIVRDYGTHYITQAEAGAILVQEDYISSQFVQDQWASRTKLTIAASASFLDKFHFGAQYQQGTDQTMVEGYKKSLTSSHVKAIGGASLSPNLTVVQWASNLSNNLVMTDRFGDPLSYLVTPEKFEGVSLASLGKLRLRLDSAIERYYAYNTHLGCIALGSPNFDYTANVDDGSCHSPTNNYTFGGVYQTCRAVQSDAGDLCPKLEQKNYATGDFNCQIGYKSVPLYSGTQIITTNKTDCYDYCDLYFFKCWKSHKVCTTTHPQSKAVYESFWCVANALHNVSDNSGYMFGGLYSSVLANPVTRSHTCPPTYETLVLGVDLKICVSNDYELGFQYSRPFAGFFSCNNGNPLVTDGKPPFTRGCPAGYSQHLAGINDNCEFHYCVKADGTNGQNTVVRPPFTDISHLYVKTAPIMTMKAAQPVVDDSLSGGSIAGIVIACTVVLLSLVIVAVFWKRRRIAGTARGGQSEPSEREPLIEEVPHVGQYGSLNSNQEEEAITVQIS